MGRLIRMLAGPPGVGRRLVGSALIESIGFGAFLTVSLLYFTSKVGLRPVDVAVALAVSGVTAAAVGAVVGPLADIVGPRKVLVSGMLCQATAMVGLSLVSSLAGYFVCALIEAIANRLAFAARGAIMGKALETSPVETRARMRSVQNVGVAVGSSLGGVALAADTTSVYRILILVNALAFIVGACISSGLPSVERRSARDEDDARLAIWAVHKDYAYLGISATQAFLCINFALFEVGMPLWIAYESAVPMWFVSVVFLLNTAFVVLFQVPIGKRFDGRSAVAIKAGVAMYFLACCFYAAAASGGVILSAAFLVGASIAGVLGEMLHMSGAWGYSFDMAPPERHGEYQAAFGSIASLGMIVGPVLVTGLMLPYDSAGWVMAGALFVLAGLVMTRLGRRVDKRFAHP